MIELREVISAELKAVFSKVYFQKAPKDAVMPYLVFDLPNILDDGEGFQLIVLDIDGWDKTDDTTFLEALMQNVNIRLNKKTVITNNLAVTFYLDRKLALTDDDPRLNRRKYIYQARKFGRS